jgi:hypothetical protein
MTPHPAWKEDLVGRVALARAHPLRLTIACLLVSGLVLTGCGGSSGEKSGGGSADDGTTITM